MSVYESHFNHALSIISEYQDLVDCHLVDFITDNLWDKCLPDIFKVQLEGLEVKRVDILKESLYDGELKKFIEKCNASTLKKNTQVLQLNEVPFILPDYQNEWKHPIIDQVSNSFMKKKKSYEITLLAEVIGYLSKAHSSLIIDVGAGKGYLASSLSETCGIPVLAIDGCESNHKSAIRRQELLKKKKHQSFAMVQNCIKFIDETTDYIHLVQSYFPNHTRNENFLLTGLHSCGSLAHSMIKGFVNSQCLSTLCVVPCCYHLTQESLTGKCVISKNGRMLAQQSVERTSVRHSQSQSVLYRAILQVLLQSLGLSNARIGRGAPTTDFPTYAQWGLRNIGLESKQIPSIEELNLLYQAHSDKQWKINAFQFIRIHLGSVIETSIILDQVIYLEKSKQCSQVSLVRLFDPLLSPRCYAIVAIK